LARGLSKARERRSGKRLERGRLRAAAAMATKMGARWWEKHFSAGAKKVLSQWRIALSFRRWAPDLWIGSDWGKGW
jgi:hypothetical protein